MSVIRKQEAVGWGAVGRVFRGWDELLDRPVAIKELAPAFAEHAPFVRAYFQKALAMADLAHPHLLATFKAEPNARPPALFRELAPETLGHQLLEGPLEVEALARFLRHALLGLGALHERGLVHLAVKPENLFVCGPVVKVGDFGLPPVEGGRPIPARARRFEAPEVQEGGPVPASDLYALGLTFYELGLGASRFEKLVEATCRAHGDAVGDEAEGEPFGEEPWRTFVRSSAELAPLHEIEAGFPVPLSLILAKMVVRNPDQRYRSCREVEGALGSLGIGTAPALDRPVAKTEIRPRSPRRRESTRTVTSGRTRGWIAGAGLALALGGTVVWLSSGRDSPAPLPLPAGPSGQPAPGLARVELALEPPGSRVAIDSPIRFRVRPERSVHFALFAVFSDGSVALLYPGPSREPAHLGGGQSVVLPFPADEARGFEVRASPPPERLQVFLLTSEAALPAPPAGRLEGWFTVYPAAAPAGAGTAADFLAWVEKVGAAAGLGVLEFEVF